MRVFDPRILVERYLLSEKTKNSERSDEKKLTMALAMANVVEKGPGQLMVQVRRVENCVANAQTLFLVRKYEDMVCLALTTNLVHSHFPRFRSNKLPYQLPNPHSALLPFQYVAQSSGKILCITVLL